MAELHLLNELYVVVIVIVVDVVFVIVGAGLGSLSRKTRQVPRLRLPRKTRYSHFFRNYNFVQVEYILVYLYMH